jgi:hypothetical protein
MICRDGLAGAFRVLSRSILLAVLALLGGCAGSINNALLAIKNEAGDPEAVREAVLALSDWLAKKETSGYPFDEGDLQGLELLKTVALESRDFVNRMRAITALSRLKRFDHTEVYLRALQDEFWGVRWEAAKALTAHPAPQASEELARRLALEDSREVRGDLIKALAAVGDRVALKALLEVFLDAQGGRYSDYKLKAYDAIRSLSGKETAFEDVRSWQELYDREFRSPPPRAAAAAAPEEPDCAGAPPAGEPAEKETEALEKEEP